MTRYEAMMEGLSRTFGETDGVESILLGLVTGGFMGGGTSLVQKPTKARDARAEAALKILNSGVLNDAVERGQGNERTLYYIKKMEEAREKGNEELFEQYRTQAILSDVISVDNAGLMDLYYEKLDDAASLSDEEFAKQFGYNEDAKFNKHTVVDNLKKDLKLAIKRKNALDAMFPITQTRGVPRLLMSDEKRAAEEQNNKENLMLRDHLLQNSFFLDKVTDRKKEIAKRISEVFPGATLSNLEKFADQAKEKYDTLIEAAILKARETDPSITNEEALSDAVKNSAYTEALASFVNDMAGTVNDSRQINPADKAKLASGFANYYGIHAHQQELFEDWNRLETTQGRKNWLRAALLDQKEMNRQEADKSVEDLIQQEIDPEKIAKGVSPNASPALKEKAEKEAKNIQNIKKNINDEFMDPSVTLDQIDGAIEARAFSEEAINNGFESTEEKQAYIELLELRNIKKSREANMAQETANKERQEAAEREKEISYTALIVDNINKLKKVYKPVHPNEYYHHSTIQYKPANLEGIDIGKKSKLKIIGRLQTDKIDVLLVENPKSQEENPHIVLSTAEGVRPEDANAAIKKAMESARIKMYKTPRYVNVTEGYVNGNNRAITELVQEQPSKETVDSPAAAQDLSANEVSENEQQDDVQLELPFNQESSQEAPTLVDKNVYEQLFQEKSNNPATFVRALSESKFVAYTYKRNLKGGIFKSNIKDLKVGDKIIDGKGRVYEISEITEDPNAPGGKRFDLKKSMLVVKSQPLTGVWHRAELESTQYFSKENIAPRATQAAEEANSPVDESGPVVLENEFIDPEVLAQELEAQNSERRMMEEGATQELTNIPTQDELLKLEEEERKLLEEEARLRKDLGKEDDNCAT